MNFNEFLCFATSFRAVMAAGLFGAAVPGLAGCGSLDGICETDGCFFSSREWERVESLAGLGDPDPDPANKWVGDARAERLGQKLFFDARLSGPATQRDLLGRTSFPVRAPRGQWIQVSCATCHDPRAGGTDHTSVPGHVSIGSGWYDVNSMPTINSAYYKVKYWNGRYDSLVWQAMAVGESGVSMNGTRLASAWLLHDVYRSEYEAIFGAEFPFPFPSEYDAFDRDTFSAMLDGAQCRTEEGVCPRGLCREVEREDTGDRVCLPRFPVAGKRHDGTCDYRVLLGEGETDEAAKSAGALQEAFDCMDPSDQNAITRVYVNLNKAIAAYEYRLVSRDSAFDRWVAEGPKSELISERARRGAKLFVGKAACIECHNSPLFSDQKFHNIGVPQGSAPVPTEADCPKGSPVCDCVTPRNCFPWGAYTGLQSLQRNTTFRGDSREFADNPDRSRAEYYDLEITDDLKGAWRTPSLRDVALTAPYMHNGAYATLADVVRHYNEGGTQQGAAQEHRSKRIAPLGLDAEESQDIVDFLQTLTGAPLPAELVTAP